MPIVKPMLPLGILGGAVVGVIVVFLEPSALLSLAISYGVVVAFAYWTRIDDPIGKALFAATVIHAVSLSLYAAQSVTLPEYLGFTGPAGIGTDDHFFYSSGAIDLDEKFILRSDYFLSSYAFSEAIRLVLGMYYYLFGYNHALQIILLNNIGGAIIPIFVICLVRRLGAGIEAQRLGFLFSTFGPYLLANSTILLRDGWIAASVVGSLAALLGRQWLLAGLLLVVAYFMRLESILIIAGNALIIMAIRFNSEADGQPRRIVFLPSRLVPMVALSMILIIAIATNPALLIEFSAKAVLGRPDFVQGFIRQFSAIEGGTSTLLAIYNQPFPIRIIGGFIFFFGAPFLALNLLIVNGVFVPRAFLQNLHTIVFVCTLPLFVRAVVSAVNWRNGWVVATILIFVTNLLALALVSLQIRHKTMVLPLYYAIACLGIENKNPGAMRLGLFLALCVMVVNVVFTIINML